MRLTHCPAVAGLALLGCLSQQSETSRPKVAEPMTGQVLDRCLARVRMTAPASALDPAGHVVPGNSGNQGLGHADWRINGGYPNEAVSTSGTAVDEPFIFSVTLVPGANHLELGRCDVADRCGWTGVDLTVTLKPGSPDPAFAHTGILAYPPNVLIAAYQRVFGLWPLADGRLLVAADRTHLGAMYPDPVLLAFKPDGSLDASFGSFGAAPLPVVPSDLFLAPRSGGGYAALFSRGPSLAHLSATGAVDTSFGTQGLLPIRSTAALEPVAFAGDGSGGYWLAGAAIADGSMPFVQFPFVMHIDDAGTELAFQHVADGYVVSATVDATGRAAFLMTDRVLITGGTSVSLPVTLNAGTQVGTIRFAHNGDVLVGLPSNGTAPAAVYRIAGGSLAWTVALPFDYANAGPAGDARPQLVEAADGTIYVAGPWTAPPDGLCCRWFPAAGPSVELGLVRIVGSHLDTAFGTQGIAHASSALSWLPMATEQTVDSPTAVALGPDGAPWVVGLGGTGVSDPSRYTQRGLGVVLTRFLP